MTYKAPLPKHPVALAKLDQGPLMPQGIGDPLSTAGASGVPREGAFGAWGKIVGILLVLLGAWLIARGQDKPAPAPPASCLASVEDDRIMESGGRREEWLTYTARADKLLLFSKAVRVPKGGREKCKACDKAMAEAAHECAKWVSAQVKPKRGKK